MRKLHANGDDVADSIIIGLACVGYQLKEGSKLLDYGCGAGALVYRFRELGFDAFGFDIHDVVNYRDPADRAFFRFFDNPEQNTSNMVIASDRFRLPFEADSFDLIISTTVLEHVLEPAPVMAEVARALRPDGYALHFYPKKNTIIEPHLFVPFASRIQSWWWFYLWALLGVRNRYQVDMGSREVADRNMLYCRTGLRYHTDDEMYAYCSRYFKMISFVDDLYYATCNPKDDRRAVWQAIKSDHPLWNLGPIAKLRVLLTGEKR